MPSTCPCRNRRGGRDPQRRARHLRELRRARVPPAHRRGRRAARASCGTRWPRRATSASTCPSNTAAAGSGCTPCRPSARRSRRAGCSLLLIVVSPAIVGSIITRHGTERAARGLAARHRRGHHAGRVRDHRARRRHELAQPLDGGATRDGDATCCAGTKTYISGVEDAHAILVIARKREDDGSLGLPLLMLVDTDSPGLEKQFIPIAVRGVGQAVDSSSSTTSRCRPTALIGESETAGLKAAFDGLNPERIMGAAVANGVGRRALELASDYAQRAEGVGRHADRRAPGPLAPARAGEDRAGAGPADDAEGGGPLRRRRAGAGEAANMAKYAAAEAAIQCVDQAIQTHGGNGFALEYGLTDMYWGARLDAHRPGLARDDPELRGRALARPAALVLGQPARPTAGGGRPQFVPICGPIQGSHGRFRQVASPTACSASRRSR